MSALLYERALKVRSRLLVRAWENRQRGHAKGVWARLRRELALAERVFAVDEADAARIESRGDAPLAVGLALHPPIRMYVLADSDARSLDSARPLAVGLGADFLAAERVVLVRFPVAR